jgi:signal transduction histidine kinase
MNLANTCQHKTQKSPKAHDCHFVHIYQNDVFLVGAIQEFIKIGMEQNEGIVIIATEKHIQLIKKDLPLHKPNQLVFVDANFALSKIMTNHFINKNKFQDLVGTLITDMKTRYRNVRFFGEIVDILCSMGMKDEASELEGYWNELLHGQEGISLLCGYSEKHAKLVSDADKINHNHSQTVSKGKDESKDLDALYGKIAALEMRIANHKMNERHFDQITQEVSYLKKQVTQATKLSLLGEITSNLAHELLNPLTIIGSYTSVLKSVIKEEQFAGKDFSTKQIEGIDKTVFRMTDLMKNILLLASSNNPRFVNYSVTQSVLTAIELMGPHLKSKNIRILFHPGPQEILSYGDTGLMVQVLLNLIMNSRDAIEEAHGVRGGVISITEKITSPTTFELLIDDNGIGMKKVVMENIFRTFFTTKQAGKGTGLGLPIVKKTIKDFNGTISCTSMYNQGTQFTVTLPRK